MDTRLFNSESIQKICSPEAIYRILNAALDAVDPKKAVEAHLRVDANRLFVGETVYDLNKLCRVVLVGFGKAVLPMAEAAVAALGDRICGGALIAKQTPGGNPQRHLPLSIQVFFGTHPLPSGENLRGSRALLDQVDDLCADDLVICLVSGGGSALFTLPVDGISLDELQTLTSLLLASGADINEINALRKHLDQVKGGGLAQRVAPARLVTLILSDVIGSPLDVIASGATAADNSTYLQAYEVLGKYDLIMKVPKSIREVLQRGMEGELPETLKAGDPVLDGCQNRIVGSNKDAAAAALKIAEAVGFKSMLLTTFLQGEARQVGVVMGSILREMAQSGQPLARPACLMAGGETTVTLRGGGRGGRNQELALGAAPLLDGLTDVLLVTLATDGEDGPTDAAGAVVTGNTLARARALGLDYRRHLRDNNSYAFFDGLGDLVRIGATGTNVNDLAFLFTLPAAK